jgi:hypothetical protein
MHSVSNSKDTRYVDFSNAFMGITGSFKGLASRGLLAVSAHSAAGSSTRERGQGRSPAQPNVCGFSEDIRRNFVLLHQYPTEMRIAGQFRVF